MNVKCSHVQKQPGILRSFRQVEESCAPHRSGVSRDPGAPESSQPLSHQMGQPSGAEHGFEWKQHSHRQPQSQAKGAHLEGLS